MVVASVVETMSTVSVPRMPAMIGRIKMWSTKIEIVAAWIAGIDAEVPVSGIPIEWTEEIRSSAESLPLP